MREDTMGGKPYLLAQLGDDGNPEIKIIVDDIEDANELGMALVAALAIENKCDPANYIIRMAIGAAAVLDQLGQLEERED